MEIKHSISSSLYLSCLSLNYENKIKSKRTKLSKKN